MNLSDDGLSIGNTTRFRGASHERVQAVEGSMIEIESQTSEPPVDPSVGFASDLDFAATCRFIRPSAHEERTWRFREPFEEVGGGLRINFADGAKIRCSLLPKTSPFLSPPDFDSFLRIDIQEIASSNFVTVEREVEPENWRGAKRFQVALAGASSVPMAGHLRFRLYEENGTFMDFDLGSFNFTESRTIHVVSGLLPEETFSQTKYTFGRFLIFGESKVMKFDIHYISLELHA